MVEISITLPEKLSDYIQQQVTDQGLKSANDYLVNLIKEDRQQKAETRLMSTVENLIYQLMSEVVFSK